MLAAPAHPAASVGTRCVPRFELQSSQQMHSLQPLRSRREIPGSKPVRWSQILLDNTAYYVMFCPIECGIRLRNPLI